MHPELTERQRRILARLVAEYIEQGEPVSSSWLAEHSSLGLSSATVRNVLARLEEQGLVRQPHTSAGRVPTDSGYRLYVDSLLGARKRPRSRPAVEARLRQSGTLGELLEGASQELSRVSQHVGFAMAPAGAATRLRHIDFVGLDARRVLVIVVSTSGEITHRAVETDARPGDTTLRQAANYINSEFAGLTLDEARRGISERMREERAIYDALMARALQLARSGLSQVTSEETLHVQGVSQLLDQLLGPTADRETALDALRVLFRMIEEKHQMIELLSQYMDGTGLTVVIGSEHLSPDLQPFSVVASTFHDGARRGTMGVIGPTRMRYQKAILVVDEVSQVVSRMLEDQQPPD